VIKRALALITLIASVCVLVPLAGERSGGGSSMAAAPIMGGRAHAEHQPKDGKIFVLILGSDARSGNPTHQRADGVHLVGINTETMKGGILNFPRDSWVNIPGSGSARINEALNRGGPDLAVRTMESLTGIQIDYWILTAFEGFQYAVKDLGGAVPVPVKRGMYDHGGSGANIPPGTKTLTPVDSLAFVRTRKSLAGGDVARTTNHGRFLLGLLKKLRGDIERRPDKIFDWMHAARKWTALDIPPHELFQLGVLTSQVKTQDVGNVTVPVRIGAVGSASVVFIQPGAESIYARFKEKGSL
jgi:polyisoprenyl-teichoic acid--peptidoglycan teichoic acid transferase